MQEVQAFLASAGLEKYSSRFKQQDFDDIGLLKGLSVTEISELAEAIGMPKGAEIKLRRALEAPDFSGSKPIRKRKFLDLEDIGHKQAKNGGEDGATAFIEEYNTSGFQKSQGRQVYVSNVGWDSRWKDLKELLSCFGDVVRVTMERKEDGLSKGYALVLFRRAESAQKCVAGITGLELDGRPLFAHMDKFEGKPRPGNEKRVFVGNLPYFVTWGALKSVCLKYGRCHADLIMDDKGRSKGYGIVEFQNQNAAYACVRELNGQIFLGRRIIVKFDNLAPHMGKGRKKQEVPSKEHLDKEMEAYSAEVAQ